MQDAVGIQENPVEQALLRQGRVARQRDRVRRATGFAAWPSAVIGSGLLSHYGASGDPDAFVSWILLVLALVLLIVAYGWWLARQLSPRVPPWPGSQRAARVGTWAAAAVGIIVAVLLARTIPAASLLFGALVAGMLVTLRVRERTLDRQFEQLGHDILVLVGYR
ncbi:hypothetical protein [Actinoplanes sp. NPDC020271]|uniref:hypothetical protein n=1 Tax=Actinoplanes sp. NPDC020271 TaxID=3363896 RepID=UPI0037AFC4D3